MEFSDNIKEFIEICKRQDEVETADLTQETKERLRKFTDTQYIDIMIKLPLIRQQLNSVSLITEFIIYKTIFSKVLYSQTKENITDYNKFFGYYIYSGFVCESVKLKILKNILTNFDSHTGSNKLTLQEYFNKEIDESTELLNTLYTDLKTKYDGTFLHLGSIQIINEDNVPINM